MDVSPPPVVVEKVSKRFGRGEHAVAALRGVDLTVPRGQLLAVMGASGSGKSTLLHLIAALTPPDDGRILIGGQNIAEMNDRELTLFRRRHVGLVFQSFNLIPTLTAAENLALPLMLDRRDGAQTRRKADELLERLGLAARRGHRPDALSGGEQQRVAIGRALVTDPTVILADEPTGSLDSVNGRSVCELLRELSTVHGKTIVMVTHEPSVAVYAQEVAVLKDGRVIDRFPTEPFADSESLAAHYHEVLK
jgi:putative ABC transport system ATP-binding protein